jgi:O-antigen/teichoic acid export membrane protein
MTPIIVSPYLARVLGAEKLGIYSYICSISSIISTFTLIGTYNYGSRQIAYIRDSPVKINIIFWNVSMIRLVLGVLGTAIYFLFAFNSEYRIYYFLYYFWFFATIIDSSWLFIGIEEIKPVAAKNTLIKFLSIVLIFLLVHENSLKEYFFLTALSTFIANSVLIFQSRKFITFPTLDLKLWLQILKDSISLFLPQVSVLLYLQIDKLMLNSLANNSSQVAYYDQAEKIVTIPLTFITILSTIIMPKIANAHANNKKLEIAVLIEKVARYSIFAAIPMAIGICALANNFIPWYLGNEFFPVSTAIMILSPLIVLNSLLGISGNQYFTATNQLGVLMCANIATAICNIILNAILIPQFKDLGAAISTVLASFLSVIIQYTTLHRQIHVKYIYTNLIRYLLMSLPMAIIVFFESHVFDASIVTSLILIISGVSVYITTLLLSKDKIIIEIIREIMHSFKRMKSH